MKSDRRLKPASDNRARHCGAQDGVTVVEQAIQSRAIRVAAKRPVGELVGLDSVQPIAPIDLRSLGFVVPRVAGANRSRQFEQARASRRAGTEIGRLGANLGRHDLFPKLLSARRAQLDLGTESVHNLRMFGHRREQPDRQVIDAAQHHRGVVLQQGRQRRVRIRGLGLVDQQQSDVFARHAREFVPRFAALNQDKLVVLHAQMNRDARDFDRAPDQTGPAASSPKEIIGESAGPGSIFGPAHATKRVDRDLPAVKAIRRRVPNLSCTRGARVVRPCYADIVLR